MASFATGPPSNNIGFRSLDEDISNAMSSQNPDEILSNAIFSQSPHEMLLNAFQPFARLPFELRLKIWKHYLDDQTPQLYRFSLRYPYRQCYNDTHVRRMGAGDPVILEPIQCISDDNQNQSRPQEFYTRPFREITNIRNIASLTCLESRQAVLEMFPDTLNFRILTERWTVNQARPRDKEPISEREAEWRAPYLAYRARDRATNRRYTYQIDDGVDGPGLPVFPLRFNGHKDIFIFNARWEDLDATLQVSKLQGFPPNEFLKMRHVGIAVNDLRSDVQNRPERTSYGSGQCRENCTATACSDHCQHDPLPGFLSLFPLLKTCYIAGVPDTTNHHLGDHFEAGTPPPAEANCPCPVEGTRHSWPVIRSSQACGWFVIFDERSPCPFPKFSRIEELRKHWRPHFPYYQVLNHLDVRFIQPLWPICDDCRYVL